MKDYPFVNVPTYDKSRSKDVTLECLFIVKSFRLKRSNFIPVGRGNNFQEIDVDIFDDNDFYHQLLKDLIDRKATSTSDGAEVRFNIFMF